MRLFFGLPLGADARNAVAGFSEELRRTGMFGKAAWVKPECLHVTLRFLGETSPEGMRKLAGWEDSLKSSAPVPVAFGPLDAFPDLQKPKVLFLRVIPPEPVQSIYRLLQSFLAAAGVPGEDRPFTPHVTLARIRRPPDSRPAPSRPPSGILPVPDRLAAVTLYESLLSRFGPSYRPVKIFIFS